MKRSHLFLVSIALILSVAITHPYWLIKVGSALKTTVPIDNPSLLIVVSGDKGNRIKTAANLYHNGYGKIIFISGNVIYQNHSITTLMKEHAISLGVPSEHIIATDNATSTWVNAQQARAYYDSSPFNNAILVTSHFHTYRTLWTFKKIFQDTPVQFGIIGAEDDIDYQNWWKNHEHTQKILTEWCSVIVYHLKHLKQIIIN